MRARNIKPAIFKNEQLAECSMAARWLFPGLWCLADWCGRLENRPKRIKMEIFPGDSIDVDALLDELESHGLIRRYGESAEAKPAYIWIPKFRKHQHPHQNERREPSLIPPHPDESESTPVSVPERSESTTGAIGLNPESGIPDPGSGILNAGSGNRKPETGKKRPGPANFDPASDPEPDHAYRKALWRRAKAVVMFHGNEKPDGRDPPEHLPWWREATRSAVDAGLIDTLEAAVKYAEDCRDPVIRSAKGLGKLSKPGAFVAAKLRDAGLKLPPPPKTNKERKTA